MAGAAEDYSEYLGAKTARIVSAEQVENYTVYIIEVTAGTNTWTVRHRYSEFSDLHEKLLSEKKVDKNALPPKKLLGNMSKSFVEKRQKELEVYLQTLLEKHQDCIPKVLEQFLDFHLYEIFGVTHTLAEELFTKGDMILSAGEVFHMTPMQLHAISTRLQMPISPCHSEDARSDLSHVLDFVYKLKYLQVTGAKGNLGSSNINVNSLSFDMAMFKCLQQVQINQCNAKLVTGLYSLKKSLATLGVHQSTSTIKDVLIPAASSISQWKTEEETQDYLLSTVVPVWGVVTTADFSHNQIQHIDESLKLIPKVEFLSLSHNAIATLDHLQHLSCLTHLDLSHNNLTTVEALHTKIGNIKTLNLAGNKLETLEGLSKLYSLVTLDVGHNTIYQVSDMKHIGTLPCIESVLLTGNPVTMVTDYRTKVLATFNDRSKEVCLDGAPTSQKEQDTVAVLQAIQKAKLAKEKDSKRHHKKLHAASIADADSADTSSTASSVSQGVDVLSTSEEYLRFEVEALRQQGGENWLTAFNVRQEDPQPLLLSPSRSPYQSPASSPSTKRRSRHRHSGHRSPARAGSPGQSQGSQSAHVSPSQDIKPTTLPLLQKPDLPVVSVEEDKPKETPNLATLENARFAEYLKQVINQKQGETENPPDKSENFRHSLFAGCLSKDSPYSEFPACFVATRKAVHVLKALEFPSAIAGVPMMQHFRRVPLATLQQMVVGLFNQTVTIEGTDTRVTVITGSAEKTQALVKVISESFENECLKKAKVAWQDQESMDRLTKILSITENREGKSPVEINNFVVIQGPNQEPCIVILTSKYLYICGEDHSYWPVIRHTLSKSYKLSSILSWRTEKGEPWQQFQTCTAKMQVENTQGLDLNFRTKEQQDGFLACLSQLVGDKEQKVSTSIDRPWHEAEGRTTSPVKEIRTPKSRKPVSIEVLYSSPDVLDRLSASNDFRTLSVSEPLQQLASLKGMALVRYFHDSVAQISTESEELKHLMWSVVVPHVNPKQEITSCIMLSTKAVYFLSDESILKKASLGVPSYLRTHKRATSDYSGVKKPHSDKQVRETSPHSSGIVEPGTPSSRKVVRCIHTQYIAELKQVTVGMFDQSFRLTSDSSKNTFACVTRDFDSTHNFIEQLMGVLSLGLPTATTTPTPDLTSSGSDTDIYKEYLKARNSVDEYTHPSGVTFVYPNEELVSDLTYLLVEKMPGPKPDYTKVTILMYMLTYQMQRSDDVFTLGKLEPRSIVITDMHIALCIEDHVSYPLPDFVISPPENPHHVVLDIQVIENLKRVVVSDESPQDLTLVFHSEGDFVVDVAKEYFRADDRSPGTPGDENEMCWILIMQSRKDRERMVSMLMKQWSEIHGKGLPLVKT
ncbi:NISCH [Branchiostoma lanceolatum]|uniref:NISCH protein n=1 Tax=Branchiostoma lanceolatum TaxID=7740 RepID=A0A8J9ZZ53_BRALA|nr:NISCH [Branchiostoma lanceolatum]